MQVDFHYYATYCAALLAGYTHEESVEIGTASMYTDCCTRTSLKKMKAPLAAATTQTQTELMDVPPGLLGLQDITRIWSSFHFLPGDLYANPGRGTKVYLQKYRLICQPNSDLLMKALRLFQRDGSLAAVGMAMHILADTWAHRNFAGTPSIVINNADSHFYESRTVDGEEIWQQVIFRHKVGGSDDLENGKYTSSLLQYSEQSVMTLGHGRVGHLPDYSFIKYRYLPAWGDYEEIVKDNPSDYLHAFAQMIFAMKVMRGELPAFQKDTYDFEAFQPCRETVEAILRKRQHNASADWKTFGESLSGREIPPFSPELYEQAYMDADKADKDSTGAGRFILAALSHKSMVTKEIFDSGNLLAGYSVDFASSGLKGIKDFYRLTEAWKGRVGK